MYKYSKTILKEYLKKDNRIRLFRFKQSCKGFTASRYNFGIKQARGDIISYMFDDDVTRENHLEIIFDNMNDNDMIYTLAEWRHPNDKLINSCANFGEDWAVKILEHNFLSNINGVEIS